MSGGFPVYIRQRHSGQGSESDGKDVEDDASSRPPELPLPVVHRAKTWIELVQKLTWVASAAFVVYYGDWRSNLVYLLWWDQRIRRKALYLGLGCVLLNICLILYMIYSSRARSRSYEKHDALSPAAPLVVMLGLLSFCLLSFALWPVWSFLTIPLLFTLFMASAAVSPYLLIGPLRPQSLVLRAD